LHADDTPARVLDPSNRIDGIGKGVNEGRICAYVRDDRPWGSTAPPGAAYFFSVDRRASSFCLTLALRAGRRVTSLRRFWKRRR